MAESQKHSDERKKPDSDIREQAEVLHGHRKQVSGCLGLGIREGFNWEGELENFIGWWFHRCIHLLNSSHCTLKIGDFISCKLQINKVYLKFLKKERTSPLPKQTKQKINSNNQIKKNHFTVFKRRNSLQCLICDSEGSCGALSVCLCRSVVLCNFEVTLNITVTV